jgi:hypothetical protein
MSAKSSALLMGHVAKLPHVVARALAAAACAISVSIPARAIDPFEIQVYDGTADAPLAPGVELHLNTVPIGREVGDGPELPPDGQSHFTLEPSFGVTRWWELGAYLQTALRSDGVFTYAGAKFRSKFVTPPGYHPNWRLGVNLEVSRIPEAYDRDRWGTEVRPIAAWENAAWHFALNPILDTSLAGPGSSEGPSFEPALMAKYKIEERVALGIEYYANFGPIVGPSSWSEQEHYVFEAIDVLFLKQFELNFGIGEGLTAASNAFVLKAIVGYGWETIGSRNDLRARL